VALLGTFGCPGRQRIEAPVLSDHEVLHAVFRDMALYCIDKRRKQAFRGIPMSDEETALTTHILSSQLSFVV
jgi:hypothetical protein